MLSEHITEPTTEPTVEQLHANGVHFVLCRSKDEGTKKAKSAIASRWQHHPAGLEDVLKHRAAGGLLGFVPGKSGLLVIDVDKFPTEDRAESALVARLGILPLAVVSTQRGIHLYLKRPTGDGEIPNRAWALDGFSGDIRCDHGYVIGWELGKLGGVLDRLPGATPTSAALFPKPLKGMSNGQGFTVGNRTNHLNKLVYAAALRGETDFSVPCKLALAADLPPAKIATIVKKAVADAGLKASSAFDRKDASVLEEVFERQGWKVRYNLRSMRCDWSLDAGPPGAVRLTAMRRSGAVPSQRHSHTTASRRVRRSSARWSMAATPGRNTWEPYSRITRLTPSGSGWNRSPHGTA